MEGALKLHDRKIKDIMTPIKKVYMLSWNEYLNKETIKNI